MRHALIPTTVAFLAASLLSLSAEAGPPLYTITPTAVPDGWGTVTLDPQKDGYQKNNIVALTAVPGGDNCFTGWSGDLSGTQNPITLRVSGNHLVTANFAAGDACGGGSGGGGSGGSGGGTEPIPVPPPAGVLPSQGMIVGYFAQWTIYRRGYLPRDVFTSGSLEKLNVINYAFAAPDESDKCASLDTFADWGKRFDESESVDGIADTVSQPLKGNFNQLIKLKAKNRALRVLISLGGWTESYRFSAIAADETRRKEFVSSCIDMFIKGNFADGIVQPGIFDGIDIDWEYPGSCGATCDYSAADRENFVLLLKEFRSQLAKQAETDGGREYLLTTAAPAGEANYAPIDMAGVARLPRKLGAARAHQPCLGVVSERMRAGQRELGRQGDQGLSCCRCPGEQAAARHAVLRTWLARRGAGRLRPVPAGRRCATRHLRKGRGRLRGPCRVR